MLAIYHEDVVAQGYISNEKLWEMTGQININKEIWQPKSGWIGHTHRKDDSEPCKAALQWNPQGTRGRDRPRNSWRQTTLNESGKCSWSDLKFIARSREGWRRFVDNLCSWWNYGHYYYYRLLPNPLHFYHHSLITISFTLYSLSYWKSVVKLQVNKSEELCADFIYDHHCEYFRCLYPSCFCMFWVEQLIIRNCVNSLYTVKT
jgi:hypothetical protein